MTWNQRPKPTVECPKCGESFTDWDAYFAHMDAIHPNWRIDELAKSNLPNLREMAKTWGKTT